MFQKLLIQVATFFSLGRVPWAPGTVATLATLPIWWALAQAGPLVYMTVVILLFPLGVLAAQVYEERSGRHDSKEIVIDEVVGFLITMTWLPLTWQSALIGFTVFRVLDIFKPPPIGLLDKRVQGGLGVMVDDVAAGIIGSLLMQLIYSQTNWLGSQIL